jgi:hypothetical protein
MFNQPVITSVRVELRDHTGKYDIVRAPVAGVAGLYLQPIPPLALKEGKRTWHLCRGSEMTLLPHYHLEA